jgi:O-antigen ligase
MSQPGNPASGLLAASGMLPPLSRLGSWPVPAVLLGCYWLCAGAFFKPTLQFFWLANAPYIATAIVLGIELAILAAVLCFRLDRFERRPQTLTAPGLLLLLLLGWAGISLAWSVTEKPFESTGYWVQQVAAVVITWECASLMPAGQAAALARRAYALGLCGMALQAVVFAKLDLLSPLEQEWYKNTYADAAALLLVLALDGWARLEWRFSRSALGWLLALACAGAVIATYTSKTVVGAIAASGAVFLFLGGGGSRRWWAAGLAAIGMAVVLWDPVLETWERYQRDAAYASTLSERTVLWEYVWRFINDHPALGLGFDGFRNAAPGIFNVGVAHAHNDVLMVWVNLGIPGLLLAGAWYASFLAAGLTGRRKGDPEAVLPLALMAYVLVRGLVEADRFMTVLPVDLAAICIVAMAGRAQFGKTP